MGRTSPLNLRIENGPQKASTEEKLHTILHRVWVWNSIERPTRHVDGENRLYTEEAHALRDGVDFSPFIDWILRPPSKTLNDSGLQQPSNTEYRHPAGGLSSSFDFWWAEDMSRRWMDGWLDVNIHWASSVNTISLCHLHDSVLSIFKSPRRESSSRVFGNKTTDHWGRKKERSGKCEQLCYKIGEYISYTLDHPFSHPVRPPPL